MIKEQDFAPDYVQNYEIPPLPGVLDGTIKVKVEEKKEEKKEDIVIGGAGIEPWELCGP